MALRFLILHESVVVKNIIQKYIMADHGEAVVDMGIPPENTARVLRENKYDLVFAGLEMGGMSGLDVYDEMRNSNINQDTRLIIMTPMENQIRENDLGDREIKYVLPIPFTSIQFRNLLHKVFHPQADDLEPILRTRALIRLNNREIHADVLNISMDHIICELAPSGESADLSMAQNISVQFPVDYGKAIMIYLTGDLMKLKSESRTLDQRVRMTWEIVWNAFELTTATKKPLKMPLGHGAEPLSDLREEVGNLSEINHSLVKENERLSMEIEALQAEKGSLSLQVSQLQSQISEIQKPGESVSLQDVSLSALINEAARRSDDPFKLPIFKRIIEDNVKLRKG